MSDEVKAGDGIKIGQKSFDIEQFGELYGGNEENKDNIIIKRAVFLNQSYNKVLLIGFHKLEPQTEECHFAQVIFLQDPQSQKYQLKKEQEGKIYFSKLITNKQEVKIRHWVRSNQVIIQFDNRFPVLLLTVEEEGGAIRCDENFQKIGHDTTCRLAVFPISVPFKVTHLVFVSFQFEEKHYFVGLKFDGLNVPMFRFKLTTCNKQFENPLYEVTSGKNQFVSYCLLHKGSNHIGVDVAQFHFTGRQWKLLYFKVYKLNEPIFDQPQLRTFPKSFLLYNQKQYYQFWIFQSDLIQQLKFFIKGKEDQIFKIGTFWFTDDKVCKGNFGCQNNFNVKENDWMKNQIISLTSQQLTTGRFNQDQSQIIVSHMQYEVSDQSLIKRKSKHKIKNTSLIKKKLKKYKNQQQATKGVKQKRNQLRSQKPHNSKQMPIIIDDEKDSVEQILKSLMINKNEQIKYEQDDSSDISQESQKEKTVERQDMKPQLPKQEEDTEVEAKDKIVKKTVKSFIGQNLQEKEFKEALNNTSEEIDDSKEKVDKKVSNQ